MEDNIDDEILIIIQKLKETIKFLEGYYILDDIGRARVEGYLEGVTMRTSKMKIDTSEPFRVKKRKEEN